MQKVKSARNHCDVQKCRIVRNRCDVQKCGIVRSDPGNTILNSQNFIVSKWFPWLEWVLCVGVRHIHPALFNSCSLLCSAAITLVQISAQTVRERYNEGAFDNEPRYQQGRTIARAVTRGNKSQGGQEYPLFISRYFCGWCAMNFVAVGTWFYP